MLEEVFLGEAHDTCEGSRSVNLEKCSGTLTKFRVRNQNFQGTLQSALSKCCRTRKYGHAVMPTSAATPTRVTEPKASDDTSQIFPAEIFHTEESAGEAVIDTGASRTVIGSDRVPGLLRAISGALRTPVKKMASAVNFRFGNSGTLQSLYALCIPRHQKGCLRVEVVQGRTPFLISNSIMKEFGVLIDPRNQVLRFLEDSRTIPLKTCRKNLLCVEITDLLEITTERVGHKHVEEVYQREENESLVMGNTNTHKSCANIPPRVCMTTHSEVSVQNPSCIVSATAKSTEDIRLRLSCHPRRSHQIVVNKAMGSPVEMKHSYLTMELSGDEDPDLQSNKMYLDAPSLQYKTPPGVKNLQQWGETVIPSGKQRGRTFQDVVENDPCYVFQIRHRKAVSPWLRSLQNYLIAREKYQLRHQVPIPPKVQGDVNRPKPTPLPKASATKEKSNKEWEVITQMTSTSSTPAKAATNKRAPEAMEYQDKINMPVEPDAERVQQIRTQIALLQRELARETLVPDEEA